ncbi:MAG: hypothetical protein C4342_08630 [Armatimonadota bacterium]
MPSATTSSASPTCLTPPFAFTAVGRLPCAGSTRPALGHAKPLECARTEAGNQAVLDLLGGLEHGVIQ